MILTLKLLKTSCKKQLDILKSSIAELEKKKYNLRREQLFGCSLFYMYRVLCKLVL